jgi:hypothetical protein
MQDTGIITFSVCNVHQAEDSSSEMLTQGLLGMKAIILERRKWIKIKLENDENEGETLTPTFDYIEIFGNDGFTEHIIYDKNSNKMVLK